MRSTSSKNTPPPRRDWPALFASPQAAASPTPSVQNRGESFESSTPGIAYGESVIVLLHDNSSSSLCCGLIGKEGTRICFKTKTECTTETHLRVKAKIGPGIYIRSREKDKVFHSPIGDVSLLSAFQDEILHSADTSAPAWAQKFNLWKQSMVTQEAPTAVIELKAKARKMQTPAKRDPDASMYFDDADIDLPSEAEINSFQSISDTYERYWRFDSSDTIDTHTLPPVLPAQFFIQDTLAAQQGHILKLQDTIAQLRLDKARDLAWSDRELESTNLRLSDLEVATGSLPLNSTSLAPDLWSSVTQLAQEVNTMTQDLGVTDLEMQSMVTKVHEHEQELNKLFGSSSTALNDIKRSILTLTTRVDNLTQEVGLSPLNAPSMDISAKFEAMEIKLGALERDRVHDRAQIEALESRFDSGSHKLDLGGGTFLRSSLDIRAFLTRLGATDIDFGGLVCPYNIFIRIHKYIEGDGSLQDVFKSKKDIRGMNLSEDEALTIYSHSAVLPPIFGGRKTEKSEIGTLPTYNKWRNKTTQTGLAYDIERYLTLVQSDVSAIIREQYLPFAQVSSLADRMLLKAVDFVSQFMRWVDDTYALLVGGGNTAVDCWWLLTRVSRSIFEDYLAPERLTATKTTYESPLHQSSVLMWGSVRCFLAADRMLQKGFKDHPIVVGAYSQWLVSNSGRKEALEAKLQVSRAINDLASTTDLANDVKRTVAELKGKVEAAKKTADKALSKATS
mmetsp:Transcript_20683/g.30304  ORF Transcript_20683/g.30304 Transcript_20683/m.30304 type:complete len:733 (-) Transcript_20683:5335-7533(-)